MRPWRRYILFHVELILFALAFWGYTKLTDWLFPNGFIHCVLHDILHLYCPFCGGTRAFFALLTLDIGEAFRLNPAVLIAAVVALVLDLRALVMLCRGSEGRLVPPVLWRIVGVYFLMYALARNTILLFGIDRVGDLGRFWQGRITMWRAALFLPLALLMCAAFLVAVDFIPKARLARFKVPCAFASGGLLITLLWVLYTHWFIVLLYLPLCVGLIIWGIRHSKGRRSIEKNERM